MSRIHKGIRIVCLFLLLGVLLSCVGLTYGRYSSSIREDLFFEASLLDPQRNIRLVSEQGWQITQERAVLQFRLYNEAKAADQHAYLRLTATEAFDAAAATVTLTVGDAVYTATAAAITPADSLYSKMGAGTEYRFYSDGQELVWPMNEERPLTLTVTGDSRPALLRLTAIEQ